MTTIGGTGGVLRRQFPLILTVAWCAALFGVGSLVYGAKPFSGGNDPFAWQNERTAVSPTVYLQSVTRNCDDTGETPCIVNPLIPCAWNVDDHITWVATPGILAEGTTSQLMCIVADDSFHLTAGTLLSKSGALTVRLTYQPQGVSFTLVPVQVSSQKWEYRGCVEGPTYSDPSVPEAQFITGSGANGTPDTWGVPTTVTLEIINGTGRTIRDTAGTFELTLSGPPYQTDHCRSPLTDFFKQGGEALWRTGL